VTNPIHVQIPAATSPQSLPGATVQTLMTAPALQIQHSSPVTPQNGYVGAFQVIPSNMSSPEMAALMSQMGAPVGVPVYMVPQQQHQQQHSSSSGVSSERSSPASSPELSPEPIRYMRATERAPLRNTNYYGHQMSPESAHIKSHQVALKAQVAFRDIVREEKVWRPW
jgi:hypothetical protein